MTLAVAGLSRAFGGVRAVDEATFSVADGEVHGLIGPNGAGKTTLLNLVSGLLRPTAGKIELDGRRIDGLPPNRVAALGVARTYQNIRLFGGLSAADNVVVGQHLRRKAPFWRHLLMLPSALREERAAWKAAEAGLERMGMRERAHTRASDLSYGEQRRVEIAMALAQSPRVLLLDEPFAGLSIDERRDVLQLLRTIPRDVTIVMIEHDMDAALEFAERITLMHFGEVIVEGTRAEVVADPRTREVYLGE